MLTLRPAAHSKVARRRRARTRHSDAMKLLKSGGYHCPADMVAIEIFRDVHYLAILEIPDRAVVVRIITAIRQLSEPLERGDNRVPSLQNPSYFVADAVLIEMSGNAPEQSQERRPSLITSREAMTSG